MDTRATGPVTGSPARTCGGSPARTRPRHCTRRGGSDMQPMRCVRCVLNTGHGNGCNRTHTCKCKCRCKCKCTRGIVIAAPKDRRAIAHVQRHTRPFIAHPRPRPRTHNRASKDIGSKRPAADSARTHAWRTRTRTRTRTRHRRPSQPCQSHGQWPWQSHAPPRHAGRATAAMQERPVIIHPPHTAPAA